MSSDTPVEVSQSGRGFNIYGPPSHCTYGTKIEVYESSSASGPHLWLNLTCDPDVLTKQPAGEGTAHLTPKQARELIARLQCWLDEIPTRWPEWKEPTP